jgi:hypothetical protein
MTPVGGACKNLWTSHNAQSAGWEGLSTRLLLAHSGHGCTTNHTKLRGMLVLHAVDTLTHTRATNHPFNMALVDLGA